MLPVVMPGGTRRNDPVMPPSLRTTPPILGSRSRSTGPQAARSTRVKYRRCRTLTAAYQKIFQVREAVSDRAGGVRSRGEWLPRRGRLNHRR